MQRMYKGVSTALRASRHAPACASALSSQLSVVGFRSNLPFPIPLAPGIGVARSHPGHVFRGRRLTAESEGLRSRPEACRERSPQGRAC